MAGLPWASRVAPPFIAQTIADHRGYERMLTSPTAAALSLFDRLGFMMLDELGPQGILLWRQRPELPF